MGAELLETALPSENDLIIDPALPLSGALPLACAQRRGDVDVKEIVQDQERGLGGDTDGGVRALLSVSRDHLTALCEIQIGETLRLGLSLRNDGTEPRTVEAAAHTYLSVHDVTASLVSGLAGASYSDNLAHSPREAHRVQDGDVKISGPVDRIYDSAEPVAVTDPGHERTIHVDKRNAPSTIVWNPWSTYSAPLPDMADDEFPTMVCVESGAVREHAPTIEPGASWSMQVTLSVENAGV